ncbi:homoserine dehydrogenase [Garciella nitratireducens DSM 15102]|uniref:Homoserine dehydrogenase n=1 Tax=Garciella nitratireducens DSM 15102 TaxID=1121911 RepID=A0A1T4L4S6_9FIRM|nr:homoserine dehydrogenase [Garciella nitratireducens]SJZ49729.1 homoserine dehydrogenase [Garciella nitratireducens DSM 15102]
MTLKIGLLGLGTVGSGVYEIINQKKGCYFSNTEEDIMISKVLVKDALKSRTLKIPPEILVTDFQEILNDEEIQIIICVMGGMEPEYTYMLQAMEKGKHVITANKAVVSEHMDVLFKTSKKNNVNFLFEASVGGGIPIITTLQQVLKINQITEIKGILNGTTNYILTKMSQEGLEFEDTLKKAQQLGFAEADPSADIDGFDVSRKLSILSSLAFGYHIKENTIYKRGIREVTKLDMDYIDQMGYVLKYLAHAILKDGTYYQTVEPIILSKNHMISNVNEEFNLISITGNIIGELQFYGKGAGKNATANAVVGDLLYIINNHFVPQEILLNHPLQNGNISTFNGRYYFRMDVKKQEEFEKILNLISNYSNQNKIEYSNKKLFIITETLRANDANTLAKKLQSHNIHLFYARIDS